MSRRQLILIYGLAIFILVLGLDLISASKYGNDSLLKVIDTPFNISRLIYTCATLLLARLIFKKYYRDRSYFRLALAVLGLMVFFVFFRYTLEEIIFPAMGGYHNYWVGLSFGYYFLDNLYYAIVQVIIGFLLFLFEEQAYHQRQKIELLQKNREAELLFLRSQINPHFLFNTLNNIYSLVYEKSVKAPGAVLKLSELMRYILYEKQDAVPLSKEWEYIRNFVDLQQLRFDKPCLVKAEINGNTEGIYIAPYLLVPLAENAFKHGDLREDADPLTLTLSITSQGIRFETRNKIDHRNKDLSGGVGLVNVRKRLELLYPGKFQLDTEYEGDHFIARLIIHLS